MRSLAARHAAARAENLEQGFADVVVALSTAVRAGLSIRLALQEAARDAHPRLREELRAAVARLDGGASLETSLRAMAERFDVPDARLLAATLAIHARTGGDLPALLDETSEVIARRADARRQARALTAQTRTSGAVLTALPVAFVALLSWAGGDGLGDLYRTPTGSALLLAGLTCDLLGFRWMRRIARAAEGPA